MRCMACGAEMKVVQTVPDDTMMVAGFEYRTLQCSGCNEVERRLAFNRERASGGPETIAAAPPVSPADATSQPTTADASAASDAPADASASAASNASAAQVTPSDAQTDPDASVDASVDAIAPAAARPLDPKAPAATGAPPTAPNAWRRAVARLRGRQAG
jgi:hypothetical protein